MRKPKFSRSGIRSSGRTYMPLSRRPPPRSTYIVTLPPINAKPMPWTSAVLPPDEMPSNLAFEPMVTSGIGSHFLDKSVAPIYLSPRRTGHRHATDRPVAAPNVNHNTCGCRRNHTNPRPHRWTPPCYTCKLIDP